MSADNGVYILKTGKQYRVKHLNAIDNLYWNNKSCKMSDTMQPDMIVEMFDGCKCTTDLEKAYYIAQKIDSELPICEYGIVMLNAHMSWGEILRKTKEKTNDRTTEKDG